MECLDNMDSSPQIVVVRERAAESASRINKRDKKKRIFLVKRRRDRDLPTTFKRTALLILGSLLTWHSYLKKMIRKY